MKTRFLVCVFSVIAIGYSFAVPQRIRSQFGSANWLPERFINFFGDFRPAHGSNEPVVLQRTAPKTEPQKAPVTISTLPQIAKIPTFESGVKGMAGKIASRPRIIEESVSKKSGIVDFGRAPSISNYTPQRSTAASSSKPQTTKGIGPVTEAAGQTGIVDPTNPGVAGGTYLGASYTVPAAGDSFNILYDGYNGAGSVTQSSGTFFIGSASTFTGDLYLGFNAGGNGSYTLSGGTLDVSARGNYEYIGYSGAGTFTQTGGTNKIFEDLYLGTNTASTGSYSLSGTGILTVGTDEYIGFSGTGTFSQSGGSNTAVGTVFVGYNSGATNSLYTLSGGTLTSNRTQVSDDNNISTFTQTGGTHTTGILGLTGFQTTSKGIYNLDGGTLRVNSVASGDGGSTVGTGTFNFNGGILQARASSTNFFTLTGTGSAANVRAGGALIDTQTFAVTIGQPLLHEAALGSTLDGGLTKSGTGVLTLTGASTYTGPTTIAAAGGTLSVNNNALATPRLVNTSSILVNTGGTLLLSGTTTVSTNRINDAALVTLAGGTFNTGGFSEGTAPGGVPTAGLGALTLTASSFINFATGTSSILTFANSNGTWAGGFTLSIYNWSGVASDTDRLFVGSDSTGLTQTQLDSISFFSGTASGYLGTAAYTLNGELEVAAVPEASTVYGGLCLLGLVGYRERNRISGLLKLVQANG